MVVFELREFNEDGTIALVLEALSFEFYFAFLLEVTLKWLADFIFISIAFHDTFKLYGRPQAWSWDPRDPASLMFAYPVGPGKDVSYGSSFFEFLLRSFLRISLQKYF